MTEKDARRTTHMARLIVGLVWAFMATITSGIYTEVGYGVVEAILLGLVTVPMMLVAVYVLGLLGLWIIEETGMRRMFP